jgi:hypothetical protein
MCLRKLGPQGLIKIQAIANLWALPRRDEPTIGIAKGADAVLNVGPQCATSD